MNEPVPESGRVPPRRRGPTTLRLLGAVVVLGVFAAFGGVRGLVAGVAVAVGGFAFAGPYAFALGHVGLLWAFPAPTAVEVALVEAGLAPSLLAPLAPSVDGIRGAAAVTAWYVVLTAGVAVGVAAIDALPTVAGLLALLVAVAAYAVHRRERLRLGLADEPRTPTIGRHE